MNENTSDVNNTWKYWRSRIFITVWLTYMTYYLGRVNYSIAKSSIETEFPVVNAEVLGAIGSAFFFMYAIGQFVNGAIGDKIGARRLVALGLIVSSFINLLFGVSNGLIWMMFILWGLNGFFQAMGWAPSVKTVANWYPEKERGKWSSRLGTSYQVGGAVSWILAMFIIVNLQLDWRFAFWVAGTIMLVSGIHWYIRVRNAPEEVGLPTIEEEDAGKMTMGEIREDTHLGFEYTIGNILRNKTVWFASLGLFSLNIVRYGITEWLPYIIATEAQGSSLFPVWKTIAFPIGGIIGALVCAWISDKYLGRRRLPIVTLLFGGLGFSLILYLFLPPLDLVLGVPMLIIIGFLVFGPHVILVSTIPMEFGTRKAASTATGFIDGWGYVGATVTSYGSALFLNAFGSEGAILSWAIVIILTGLILILNWKSIPEKGEYY